MSHYLDCTAYDERRCEKDMIRFRRLDAYGQIVDDIDLIFNGMTIHQVRDVVEERYGYLRQYGMRLILNHI